MKLTKPQRDFLTRLDRDGALSTGPATGNVAKALEAKGLAKTIAIYSDGHRGDYRHLLGFEYGITNEGRAWLRENGRA